MRIQGGDEPAFACLGHTVTDFCSLLGSDGLLGGNEACISPCWAGLLISPRLRGPPRSTSCGGLPALPFEKAAPTPATGQGPPTPPNG